jgi:hypothetical protein
VAARRARSSSSSRRVVVPQALSDEVIEMKRRTLVALLDGVSWPLGRWSYDA